MPLQPVVGPATWVPADLDSSQWAYRLTPAETSEIVAAARHAVQTGKDIPVSKGVPRGGAPSSGCTMRIAKSIPRLPPTPPSPHQLA